MKIILTDFSTRYVTALGKHLKGKGRGVSRAASMLGTQSMAVGLSSVQLAIIHEQALIGFLPLGIGAAAQKTVVGRAGSFFRDALAPIEKHHRAVVEAIQRLNQHKQMLSRHTLALAAQNRRLTKEIGRRRKVEVSLKKSEAHYATLLAQSQVTAEQCRLLAHRILMTQEAERKEISRELHDRIAQTLAGISVHLSGLKLESATNTKDLAKKIHSTQRLVEKSVNIVHRFARDLRPTVLDDLGLIPAIDGHIKEFTAQNKIPVRFTSYPEADDLSGDKKTVFYRVLQAALTNVAQHAGAKKASVTFRRIQNDICMEVHDDGKSFKVERVLFAQRHKRLGVLGMRERVEMVGGGFSIESSPGKGTTIRARIPIEDAGAKKMTKRPAASNRKGKA